MFVNSTLPNFSFSANSPTRHSCGVTRSVFITLFQFCPAFESWDTFSRHLQTSIRLQTNQASCVLVCVKYVQNGTLRLNVQIGTLCHCSHTCVPVHLSAFLHPNWRVGRFTVLHREFHDAPWNGPLLLIDHDSLAPSCDYYMCHFQTVLPVFTKSGSCNKQILIQLLPYICTSINNENRSLCRKLRHYTSVIQARVWGQCESNTKKSYFVKPLEKKTFNQGQPV